MRATRNTQNVPPIAAPKVVAPAVATESAALPSTGPLKAMLPVLDAFDLADAHFKDVENDSSAALRQTRSLLIDTLAKQGLERLVAGQATSDGAGVRLTRVLTQEWQQRLDPFLMLDHFGSDEPQDYIAGFPDHPHRGFETITYMLEGRIEYRCGQETYVLEPGDALTFQGHVPHGPEQLIKCPIKFLSVIIYPHQSE